MLKVYVGCLLLLLTIGTIRHHKLRRDFEWREEQVKILTRRLADAQRYAHLAETQADDTEERMLAAEDMAEAASKAIPDLQIARQLLRSGQVNEGRERVEHVLVHLQRAREEWEAVREPG